MARTHGRPVDNDDDEKLEGIERPFGRLMAYVFRHYPVRISPTICCMKIEPTAEATAAVMMHTTVRLMRTG